LEGSFWEREDVFDAIEQVLAAVVRDLRGVELSLPLPRLSWQEAMDRYGSDKPDLRFGMEITDLSDIVAGRSSGCSPGPSGRAAPSVASTSGRSTGHGRERTSSPRRRRRTGPGAWCGWWPKRTARRGRPSPSSSRGRRSQCSVCGQGHSRGDVRYEDVR